MQLWRTVRRENAEGPVNWRAEFYPSFSGRESGGSGGCLWQFTELQTPRVVRLSSIIFYIFENNPKIVPDSILSR